MKELLPEVFCMHACNDAFNWRRHSRRPGDLGGVDFLDGIAFRGRTRKPRVCAGPALRMTPRTGHEVWAATRSVFEQRDNHHSTFIRLATIPHCDCRDIIIIIMLHQKVILRPEAMYAASRKLLHQQARLWLPRSCSSSSMSTWTPPVVSSNGCGVHSKMILRQAHSLSSIKKLDTRSVATTRYLSTATADSAKGDNKKNDSNIFLDNLGTIFLTVIGLVIASLVRSFYGSTRKNALRSQLEEAAALDPVEVDDLRFANPFFSVNVFRSLIADVRQAYPTGQATYTDVVKTVRQLLQSKHKIPTIELGYLLDRVAMQVAQETQTKSSEPQSVTLWLVVLSLALNAPVPDRIRILYEIMETDSNTDGSASTVTLLKVRDLVGYLQSTSQLVLDTQVIPTESQKYPIQAYHRGTPDELVRWDGGGLHDPVDIDALAAILRSKSVCAWGECYSKKKFT
eukprot:scaffold1650_cov163-Amphora_coffeaeformis.AAC.1